MTGWLDQEHNECSIACWVSSCPFQSRGHPNAGNVPLIPFIMVTTSKWISGPSVVTMTTVFHRLTLWPWQLHQAMLSHGPLCPHGTSGMAASLCKETTSPSPLVSHCHCHHLWGWHSLVWSCFIPTHNYLLLLHLSCSYSNHRSLETSQSPTKSSNVEEEKKVQR